MIVLTKPQADAVRGVTVPGHALEPRELDQTPRFILGEEVLSDPFHQLKRSTLAGATRRELTLLEKTALSIESVV